jgi:uncharacterized protein YbaR (Trm112 family)
MLYRALPAENRMTIESNDITALLACPRCDSKLEQSGGDYRCKGCKVDFPLLAGIPWLFAEPAAALGEWRGRMHLSLRQLEHQQQQLEHALQGKGLRDITRSRLDGLSTATADHAQRLRSLLAPLEVASMAASYETYLALRTRLPSDQGLMTYYDNVHRDWAWGEQENQASIDIVGGALAGHPLGRTLVLGAGAGRLAYDIHTQLSPETTVALDFNPLLMIIARRVTLGESIELYEFPIAPRTVADYAVLRSLSAPAAPDGLHWMLADTHRPPFAKGAFATIVTPWLVDIVPEPLEVFAARINHLLADGGRWINFGSLTFHISDPAHRYGVEECTEVLTEAGFEPPRVDEQTIPYMCSPASRHGRQERVVAWSARKERSVKQPARYRALPEWIVRGDDPVPLSPAFQTQIMSTRIHAFIMSLIDGKRSLKDIAKVLADQKLMTAAEAEPALRSFLTRMFEDSRRHTAY